VLAGRLRELFDQGLTLDAAVRIVGLQDELSIARDQLAAARDELGGSQARELGVARDQLDAARARVAELESRTTTTDIATTDIATRAAKKPAAERSRRNGARQAWSQLQCLRVVDRAVAGRLVGA
jgi:hypothetical protein